MKNLYTLILGIALLFTLSFSAQGQEVITQKQSRFVSKFVGAVNVQKKNKVYKKVSKAYRQKTSGTKEEVLSALFAGKVTKSGTRSEVPFDKIYSMRMINVREVQSGILLYNFILETPEGPVETSLYLMKQGKKGKFGFQPAQN